MTNDPAASPLRRASAHFAGLEGFSSFAAYLDFKEQGLKPQAKRAAEAFARALAGAPLEQGVEIVRALEAGRRSFADPPGFMPFPVAIAAAEVCKRWEEAEPGKAEPLLLRAAFERDPYLVTEAVRREPSHQGALKAEIRRQIAWMTDAFHHAHEGAVLADKPELRAGIAEARALCGRVEEAEFVQASQAVLEELAALTDGHDAWEAAGRPGDFPAFMRTRGVRIDAAATYYFAR
ncbi:MAG: hypothetical protein ACOC05_10125 [Oceanicaulis sp.]